MSIDKKEALEIVQHPVVSLARAITKRGTKEKWFIDPRGALLLEAAILRHREDAQLPMVLRALFGMVRTLHAIEQSPKAAQTLIAVLARVEPHLVHLRESAPSQAAAASEAVHKKSRSLLGTQSDGVKKLADPPPEGAISVRALHIPSAGPNIRRPGSNARRDSDVTAPRPAAHGSPPARDPSASRETLPQAKEPLSPRAPSRPRSQPRFRLEDDLTPPRS